MILSDEPTPETETPVEEETNYYKVLAGLLGAPIALALTREQVAAPFSPKTRSLVAKAIQRMHQGFLDHAISVTEHSVPDLTETALSTAERATREVTGLMQGGYLRRKDVPIGPMRPREVFGDIMVAGLGKTPSGKSRTPVSQAKTLTHEFPHLADALRVEAGGEPLAKSIKEPMMDAVGYSMADEKLKRLFLLEDIKNKTGRYDKMFTRRQEPAFRKNMAILLKIMRRGRG